MTDNKDTANDFEGFLYPLPNPHWDPQICALRHEKIEKEIQILNEKLITNRDERKEVIKEIEQSLAELKESCKKDVLTCYKDLRDKIVISNRSTGEKFDTLVEFDQTLKGNGNPGVWETIRELRWKINIMMTAITLIAVLALGGNIKGVSWHNISHFFSSTPIVHEEKTLDEADTGGGKKSTAPEPDTDVMP